MNNERTAIEKEKAIYLCREGAEAGSRERFTIVSEIGCGGSCICYEATFEGENKTGRLKEFYPMPSDSPYELKRQEGGCAVATEPTREAFKGALNEFVNAYHKLSNVKAASGINSDFNSFIPDYSIYYACDEQGRVIDGSTAYIWTAPENLTVFEDYISDVRRHPNVSPEHKLFNILKIALSLTECIKIFHENGLLHLDIKPGNFGIPKRKDRLLTDTVTLFDVNTIYSLKDSFSTSYGTEGFCAPEIANGYADNRSDIYSIGCTLFSALMVNDRVEGIGYERKYYSEIAELIDTSKLITSSEANSNVFLKERLVSILKKCLNMSMDKRYQSCSELAKELEEALGFLYPAEVNEKMPLEMRLALIEKELDKKRGAGSYLTLMYHLYKNPLFEGAFGDGKELDVLIVGFGNYGQRFLDCCLQAGQMLGKSLNVTVVSNNKERDRGIYFKARPAIREFFSIDGKPCKDAYGQISFEEKKFERKNLIANKKIGNELIAKYKNGCYVFVALGDDDLNKGVAEVIATSPNMDGVGSVNFVYEGENIQGEVYGNPVYMSKDIRREPLFKDIERMAFNAHLIWESGLNIDLSKSFAKFKEPYNYNASVANVISIKYKLYSFGISMDDLSTAASQCYQRITNVSDEIKNELIALEHRRWVCEKICAGWSCKRDLRDCLTGETNDKKAKKHVCLVKSTSEAPLQTAYWTKSKWDSATKEELEKLDDLDRMSVMLHQTYKAEADRIRRESTLLDPTMLQLKRIIKKSKRVSVAFAQWYSCLSLLWNGNDKPLREYEKLKKSLIETLTSLEGDDFSTARALVKLIDDRFAIILKSMRRVDYKNYDAELVNYIPFILTHKKKLHLAIPFYIGGNTEIFKNVASSTVVNPEEITYFFCVSKAKEVAAFKDAIGYVLNYMEEKNVTAKLNFIIAHLSDNKIFDALEQLEKELLSEKSNNTIKKIIKIKVENKSCIAKSIERAIDTKFKVDGVECNEAPISVILAKDGYYDRHSNYRFDINTLKFYDTQGCEPLKYIKAGQHLKVSDMLALKGSGISLETPASFYNDYEALWQVYRKNQSAWQGLCHLLSKYHRKTDEIAVINKNDASGENGYKKYRFLVPAVAYEGAKKIISAMTEAKVLGKESEIYYYTTDSCEVNIYATPKIEASVKVLMRDAYILSQPESIGFDYTKDTVSVTFDCLRVENVDLNTDDKGGEQIKDLLKLLESEFAFITDYKESRDNSQSVSFAYATNRIKRLLVSRKNIFETYAYHKCLKSNLFDDVKTGDQSAKNDFDIIVTKGFAGLLIKAMAEEQDLEDCCARLSCLAKDIGINCKPVLIVDKHRGLNEGANNTSDVIVISDPCEIDEIDRTLADLFRAAQ